MGDELFAGRQGAGNLGLTGEERIWYKKKVILTVAQIGE